MSSCHLIAMQITALEQLRGELQEELFQQSVANTQLHTVNQNLTAQLAKAEEKNGSLERSVASLSEERLKVTHLLCTLSEGRLKLTMLWHVTVAQQHLSGMAYNTCLLSLL